MIGKLLSAAEVEKLAGSAETNLPWYGVTAGGVLGGAGGGSIGGKLGPKGRLIGTLAGALAGTAAGLHGGEAAGRLLDNRSLKKAAAQEEAKKDKDSHVKRVLKVMGRHAAGFGLGAATGAGLGYGGSALHKAVTGRPIPGKYIATAPALIGSGIGLAYPLMKAYEKRELDDALQSS